MADAVHIKTAQLAARDNRPRLSAQNAQPPQARRQRARGGVFDRPPKRPGFDLREGFLLRLKHGFAGVFLRRRKLAARRKRARDIRRVAAIFAARIDQN